MIEDGPQLKRRVQAAMALRGIRSWEKLAAETGVGASTLKAIGTPRWATSTREREKHLSRVIAACDVSPAWFAVPDLAHALDGSEEATMPERVEALESRLGVLERWRADEDARRFAAQVDEEDRRRRGLDNSDEEAPPDEDATG